MPKYPNVHVKMVGEDGNAYAIMGRCRKAMRRAGVSMEEQTAALQDMMSGDYNNLLATTMKLFNVDAGEDESEEDE